jgi:hypothetical protein
MAALVAISYAPARGQRGNQRDLVSSWRSSSQYHMLLHECQKGRSTSQTRHATGWLCSRLTPTLRLANAAPMSASTHLRALWSSACTCGVSLPSATSSKLLMHRSTPLVEKPRENLAFYRRDVVNHRTAVQRPTSRSSKLVSRRATPSQTRQL